VLGSDGIAHLETAVRLGYDDIMQLLDALKK
jgi:hypothetical protein